MKVADKVICLFLGHYYSRFERRSPSCVYCGTSRRGRNRKVSQYVDRRNIAIEDAQLPKNAGTDGSIGLPS
jgi:biotin synthase-like enzyme